MIRAVLSHAAQHRLGVVEIVFTLDLDHMSPIPVRLQEMGMSLDDVDHWISR